MARVVVDGVVLEYEDCGAGEPVVCIHGAFIADVFRPLLSERGLAERYRLVSYHRRGYGGSSHAGVPTSLSGRPATVDGCCRLSVWGARTSSGTLSVARSPSSLRWTPRISSTR